jgi:hypothetical protein
LNVETRESGQRILAYQKPLTLVKLYAALQAARAELPREPEAFRLWLHRARKQGLVTKAQMVSAKPPMGFELIAMSDKLKGEALLRRGLGIRSLQVAPITIGSLQNIGAPLDHKPIQIVFHGVCREVHYFVY